MISEQLSVEELLSGSHLVHDRQDQLVLNSQTLDDPRRSTINRTFSLYDLSDYIDPQDHMDKHELDVYVPFGDAQGQSIGSTDQNEFERVIPHAFERTTHESIQEASERSTIPLVQSDGLTRIENLKASSNRIEIVRDLELIHKGRYKTDYFQQNGRIRSPRYVSDREGNHYVSLKVMSMEPSLIRTDWVTIITADNMRYSMPYKFQTNHESPDALDHNPIYSSVDAGFGGLFKHYVVLIKSKQDELRNISSLSVFPPIQPALEITPMNHSQSVSSLAPKELIERFQLDKSQLAFTFCTLGPDGQTYTPNWETTVYSSIMTETPSNNSSKRHTTCPSCSHCFEIASNESKGVYRGRASKRLKKQ